MAEEFISVSRSEIYHAVEDLRTMTPDSSPLVRQVSENKKTIASLSWRVYVMMGALGAGLAATIVRGIVG